jgi:predicted dehydrogenase
LKIYGSKSSVGWDSERPNELWIGKRNANNEILLKDPSLMHQDARKIVSYPGGHNEGFPDTSKQMFFKLYKYLIDTEYLKGTTPDFPTFEAGLRELVLCETVCKSSKEGKWITME